MNLNNKNKAILALVIVSFFYALMGIASRLMKRGFEPFTQIYLRVLIGFFISYILLNKKIVFSKFKTAPKKDLLILFSMGLISGSIAVYFVTMGVLNAKLLNVATIFSTTPFFAYLFSFFFLKKSINLKLIGLLLISLVGVSFVGTKAFIPQTFNFGNGEFYVLLSAIAFGWSPVARKMLSKHFNNSEITFSIIPIAFLCTLTLAFLNRESLSLNGFSDIYVLLGLAIGATNYFISTYFKAFAFEHLDSVLGSQVLLLENFFSPILGFVFYNEILSLPEITGAFIIISTVYIANKYLPS